MKKNLPKKEYKCNRTTQPRDHKYDHKTKKKGLKSQDILNGRGKRKIVLDAKQPRK